MSTAGVEDHQPVVVLMHTSAELLSQLPALSPQQIKQQRLAYLVAAAAALGEFFKQSPPLKHAECCHVLR